MQKSIDFIKTRTETEPNVHLINNGVVVNITSTSEKLSEMNTNDKQLSIKSNQNRNKSIKTINSSEKSIQTHKSDKTTELDNVDKLIIGEQLFPLIHEIHPEMASKITGMLLELEISKIMHLLEDNRSLKAKVDEAVAVLQIYTNSKVDEIPNNFLKADLKKSKVSKKYKYNSVIKQVNNKSKPSIESQNVDKVIDFKFVNERTQSALKSISINLLPEKLTQQQIYKTFAFQTFQNSIHIRSDITLTDIIHSFSRYYCSMNSLRFWQMISNEMIKLSFNEFNPIICHHRFNTLITDYLNTLSKNDCNKSCNELPFFAKMKAIYNSCPNLCEDVWLQINTNQDINQNSKLFNNLKEDLTKKLNKTQTQDKEQQKIQLNCNPIEMNLKFDASLRQSFIEEYHELLVTKPVINSKLINKLIEAIDVENQIELICDELLLNANDFENREKLTNQLQEMLNSNGIKCALKIFGSTVNKLGFRDSDIDIFIETEEMDINFKEIVNQLNRYHEILTKSMQFFILKPIATQRMRCPLLKLDFKYLDKRFQDNGITCDINTSNASGIQNSKLIRMFCELDPRFKSLSVILRYWAKLNGFIGTNQMSSYAFTHLVIFFCQSLSQPILPTIDYLMKLTEESLIINGWEFSFCDNIELIEKSKNTETEFELLKQFFEFYANLDFKSLVICPKTGLSLNKNTFSLQFNGFKVEAHCCVRDPFIMNYNITGRFRKHDFNRFINYIKYIAFNADVIFGDKQSNTDWGITRIVTEFNPTFISIANPISSELTSDESSKDDNLNEDSNENIPQQPFHVNSIEFNMMSDSALIDIIILLHNFYISMDSIIFWQMISNEMISRSYSGVNPNVCLIRFNILMTRYLQTLFKTSDTVIACNLFPLFFKLETIYNSCEVHYKKLFIQMQNIYTCTQQSSDQSPTVEQSIQSVPQQKSDQCLKPRLEPKPHKNEKKVDQSLAQKTRSVDKYHYFRKHNSIVDNFKDLLMTKPLINSEILSKVLIEKDINQQIVVFCGQILLNSKDIANRVSLTTQLQEILCKNGFKCVLHIFGSTVNDLGFRDSDLDIFLETLITNNIKKKLSFKKSFKSLNKIEDILNKNLDSVIQMTKVRSPKSPQISVHFKSMNQNHTNNGIVCNILISNAISLQKTKLIRLFCDIEPRFQKLATILRYWAKINGFICYSLSSYSFTQLVIFFCQNLSSPLLPTVDYLRQLTKESVIMNGWECGFCDNTEVIKKSLNRQSVLHLLNEFFNFYANFEFNLYVICIRTGLPQFKHHFKGCFESKCDLCIRDPFDLDCNLTEKLSQTYFKKLIDYIKHIAINSDTIFCLKNELLVIRELLKESQNLIQ